jgi:hypothetical protein
VSTEVRIVVFVCLLAWTIFLSYKGDDDVVYQYFDRKPTGREALIRIRWVMLKFITSIQGGALLAVLLGFPLIRHFHIAFSKHEAGVLGIVCVCIVGLAIGILQNGIRRLCGRPNRPPLDLTILQKNLRQRRGK